MAETTDTPSPMMHGAALAPREAATMLVRDPDLLDRIVGLGREARRVETVAIKLPDPVHGLPDQITALAVHNASGTIELKPIRSFFKEFETAPERRKGLAKVTTLASFIELVNRHKDADSAIFAQTAWPQPKLTAILNYHRRAAEAPSALVLDARARYGDHRVEYPFPLTDEFKAWMAMNGVMMDQGNFAIFLEDHVDELAAPYDLERQQYQDLFKEKMAIPTEIVALSRDLEIHVGQKVKRKERLQSGERTLVFESTHTTASGEAVEIPGVFMISVAPFVDGDPVRMPARLRYRMKGADVVWFYQLYRPEFWLRAQVQNDLLDASTRTGLPAYEGAAEGGDKGCSVP